MGPWRSSIRGPTSARRFWSSDAFPLDKTGVREYASTLIPAIRSASVVVPLVADHVTAPALPTGGFTSMAVAGRSRAVPEIVWEKEDKRHRLLRRRRLAVYD